MSDHIKPTDTACPEFQGSVLRGILGSVAGMAVCLLVILLCWLCNFKSITFLFHLFVGMVIGWFYRLFHGRRSKPIAYAAVSVCTLLACVLWLPVLAAAALGDGLFPLSQLTAEHWIRLWHVAERPLLVCGGLGLAGFFLNRGKLLAYIDWQRGPWYIAGFNAGGATYNLLPKKLPAQRSPERFVVSSRFASTPCIAVEGDTLRWSRALRKDQVFSSHDIAGVVLGPSNGSIVLYGKDFRLLAKFAGSMENAAVLLRYLIERNIPVPDAPPDWLLTLSEETAP